MPFLQFLNGSRDQEFEELNPGASLVLGSGAEAHMRNGDPGIEGKHCTVYPAQGKFWLQDMGAGSTVFKMKRLAATTEGLQQGDVFIAGSTYIKFWDNKPAGGGGGGADPAALESAQTELAGLKAELEQLKGAGAGREEEVKQLEGSLAEAKAAQESIQQELETTKQELETTKQAQQEAQDRASQLEQDVATARAESESAVSQAKEEAQQEREEIESALEASRAALEAMKAEQAAGSRDRLQAAAAPSDLAQAIEALALPDPIRLRLEAAVNAEIDREVLRRSAGPVVPLRGFRLSNNDRDVESEIRAIRRRGEQVEAARKLGLGDLESGELERLLEMARS